MCISYVTAMSFSHEILARAYDVTSLHNRSSCTCRDFNYPMRMQFSNYFRLLRRDVRSKECKISGEEILQSCLDVQEILRQTKVSGNVILTTSYSTLFFACVSVYIYPSRGHKLTLNMFSKPCSLVVLILIISVRHSKI